MSLQSQLSELKSRYSRDLSKDEAFELAYKAAELHMKSLELAKDRKEKTQLREKCNYFLGEAEKIKAVSSNDWRPDSAFLQNFEPSVTSHLDKHTSIVQTSHPGNAPANVKPRLLPAPKNSRALTTREEIILLQGTKLHGFKFPPWKSPPDDSEFQPVSDSDDGLFLDEGEVHLSVEQQSILEGWKRPIDALPPPAWTSGYGSNEAEKSIRPTMDIVHKADFVQDAATDCSVVASLSAATARAQLGHARLLSSIMFPYILDSECPAMSPNGKYVVRLFFNGCDRRVVIDDRLPVSKTRRMLHVIDRRNLGLIWPALLEKAYLKVRGGYDFPGSNSGTDLWILTGWIPEQIFLQHNDTNTTYLWPRILKAFCLGDVIMTLGTGKMTAKAEEQSGLAGSHDYAVLDMREDENSRRLLIKNPWLKGTAWKDHRAFLPTIEETEDDEEGIGESGHGDYARNTPIKDSQEGPGTFWMEMNDLMQYFDSVYLNWNPGLFKFRQDIHFRWDLAPSTGAGRSAPGSFTRNPQYAITCLKGGLFWLLLSRHFADKTIQQASSSVADEGYISLYAFLNGGQRVNLSKYAVKQGLYVDSPQTLLQLEVEANSSYTIVISEEDLPESTHNFTLSAFSNCAFRLDLAAARFSTQTKEISRWTHASAGGNASCETFAKNPQFSLHLPRKSAVSLFLETLVPNIGINCKLLHGYGERVFSFTTKDIIADSGNYHRGCVQAQVEGLDPGNYTIICSTFEAGQLGEFSLLVESMTDHTVTPIRREGAGRLRTRLTDAVFGSCSRLLEAPIGCSRLSRANFYANYFEMPSPTVTSSPASSGKNSNASMSVQVHSPIRLTVEAGRGPDRRTLVSSSEGNFSDAASGIRTEDINLDPGMTSREEVWLVLERLWGVEATSGSEETVEVEMWADTIDAIGVGEWAEFER